MDLASLEQRLQVDHKEQTDQRSGGCCQDEMVEFCILFFFVLLAGVLHEEQVCSVSAERAWVANKDITLGELYAMALLAD